MQQENATEKARPQPVVPIPGPDQEPELELHVGLKSDVGPRRELNEDHGHYTIPTDEAQRQAKGCLFIVADGMGGHKAGEVASHEAVSQVTREYYADGSQDPGECLTRAVKTANRAIYGYAQADPSKSGMGTTMVAAVLRGSKVWVANVGDSRAYVVGARKISQITQDHSWVEEQVQAGLLTRGEAERHPQRNLLTRALGTKASVEVDLFEGELNEGQALLLCSDGAHGPLSNEQMAQAVRSLPPAEAATQLVQQSAELYGEDNSTILIVKLARPTPRSVEDETPTRVSTPAPPATDRARQWIEAHVSWPEVARNRKLLLGLAAAVVFVCLVSAILLAVLLRPRPEEQPGGGVQVTPSPAPTATLAPVDTRLQPAIDDEEAGRRPQAAAMPAPPMSDYRHTGRATWPVTQPRDQGRNL